MNKSQNVTESEMRSSEAVLSMQKLTVGYHRRIVLPEMTLELKHGQIISLIGPNGAGKSTLLKTIGRQLTELGGELYLDGRNLALYRPEELAKKEAVLLTERVHPELMTCRDVVEAGRYPYTGYMGKLRDEDHRAVQEAMTLLEITGLADRNFNAVSDGQKQRVLIARAVAQAPEVLLLDEPTSYLDIRYRRMLMEILKDLKRRGVTILLSIHEVREALEISDTVLCIREGEPVYAAPPEQVLSEGRLKALFELDEKMYEAEFGSLIRRKTNYRFFAHRDCEYFPCHKTDRPEEFNCLFCYCPFYSLGDRCGGNFRYTAKGIKDCTNCTYPHEAKNYEQITNRLRALNQSADRETDSASDRKANKEAGKEADKKDVRDIPNGKNIRLVRLIGFTEQGVTLAQSIAALLCAGGYAACADDGRRKSRCSSVGAFSEKADQESKLTGDGSAGADTDAVRADLQSSTSVRHDLHASTSVGYDLHEWTQKWFQKSEALVFVGASGIAVRAVAPYVQSKASDPAVISVDEAGKYVIPLLSGHLGGANAFAEKIASLIGGTAVISTATDLHGLFAVDVFAKKNALQIEELSGIRRFSAALLREKQGLLMVPEKYARWIEFDGEIPPELTVLVDTEAHRVTENSRCPLCLITPEGKSPRKDLDQSAAVEDGFAGQSAPEKYDPSFASPEYGGSAQSADEPDITLIPRMTVIGMGCRRGKSYQALREFSARMLQETGLSRESVCALASIDRKVDEEGLQQLAEEWGVPFLTYSAEELGAVAGEFSESETVRAHVGVGNVCERAAKAAGAETFLMKKYAEDGMTIAVGLRRLKLKFDRA